MLDAQAHRPSSEIGKSLIVAFVMIVLFAALAFWGGMPPSQQMGQFILGVIVLLVVAAAICFAGWYLLIRPLPGVTIVRESALDVGLRRVLGVVLIVALLIEAMGGIWDETWHIKYGIPFGKDFFWRPHIMIYIGLLTIAVAAGVSWVAIMRQGKGSLAQRFRADPFVGLLVLTGLFLLYALPTDPIWHSIYGTDLSAFSIPHVLLGVLLALAAVCGCGMLISPTPARPWRSIVQVNVEDIVPLISVITISLSSILLLTADWTGARGESLAARTGIIFQRPEWLLPVFIVAMATLVGVLANESLRCYGAATLVGILALIIRLVLVNIFESRNRNANAWLLCLPSMVLIDVLYAYRIRQGKDVPWWMAGAAGALGIVVVLPLMNQLFAFPQVTAANLLPMVIIPALWGVLAGWLGQTTGSYLSANRVQAVPADTAPGRVWITPLILLIAVAFVVWFVATATPPVS